MDIKTLILALALGNLSLCAALFFFEVDSRQGGKGGAGMSTWSLAKQCQAVAWLLLYLRGVLPDLLTNPLANGLLFAGMALDASAMWELTGRRVWRRYLLPALGAAVGVFAGGYLIDLPAGPRVAIGSLIVAGFLLAGSFAMALAWRQASML